MGFRLVLIHLATRFYVLYVCIATGRRIGGDVRSLRFKGRPQEHRAHYNTILIFSRTDLRFLALVSITACMQSMFG